MIFQQSAKILTKMEITKKIIFLFIVEKIGSKVFFRIHKTGQEWKSASIWAKCLKLDCFKVP